MVLVVKRRGKTEPFDDKKLYASIYSACKDVNMDTQKCEGTAAKVVADVKAHFKARKEVNTTEVFGAVIELLAKHHEAAAFMYETHRELSG